MKSDLKFIILTNFCRMYLIVITLHNSIVDKLTIINHDRQFSMKAWFCQI